MVNAHRDTVKGARQLLYHCLHSIKSPGSRNTYTWPLDFYTGQANIISEPGDCVYIQGNAEDRVRTEGRIENKNLKDVRGLGMHN